MDISETLAPTSDQLDAIELVAGPRTFAVESVSAGSAEQPVQVKLEGFPRVWRPSKSMRRVLAAGWGVHASAWTGRKVTLFYDPNVTFGKERTGGTRISHMSDLPGNKPLNVPLLVTRGKSAIFTVQPLPNEPSPNSNAVRTDGITPEQLSELAGAFRDNDISTREAGLAHIAKVIGRDVGSTKNLTRDEAAAVIASLPKPPAPEEQTEVAR